MPGLIKRIILENYMSHVRSVIEPAAGLTVLVGPNNCGKSAVVNALETLCYNERAEFAVRHGQREASVTIETDDGHVLVWRRKGAKVSYVVDGREIDRLRGDVPEDLHRFLRMPEIIPEAGGEPFRVHFGLQKSPIFLLDDPASRAATFFASSSDAEKLLEMQKRHKEKTRDARRDAERLNRETDQLEARLTAFESVDALAAEVAAAEEAHRSIVAEEQHLSAGKKHLAAMEDLVRTASRLADRSAAMHELRPPPMSIDTTPLKRMIAQLEDAGQREARFVARQAASESLHAAPEMLETRDVQQLIAQIESASRRLIAANERIDVLANLAEASAAHNDSPLEATIAQIERAAGGVGSFQRIERTITSALEGVAGEVREWTERNPTCPLCGGSTSVESVLPGGHEHA